MSRRPPPTATPPRSRRTRTAVRAAVLLSAAVLTGCGDAGGLESAGPTPTAAGPVRLWPDLPPVTAPPYDYGEGETERVPEIRLPSGDVREADPVAVVQAELKADPDQFRGEDGVYRTTVRRIRECREHPAQCPVLRPYYRDLTGDGRDELIVAVRMEEQQTGLRVYMPERGGLTRILSDEDQVVGVQIAGRSLVVRAVSAGIPGYEYRTTWTWEARQRAMLPASDEIVRVRPAPSRSSARPSGSPSPAPSRGDTPSGSPSAEASPSGAR
ncbi:hypothetical protein [Streptomyces lichenis]|uniref:Lipoprotein n=1 Tax=Streptomyces lichenis TaxID=2306967 RepID=A0ABT0I7Y2_9ACTN|nr:hypothetical protein [Streptomyces lichenis]MCK8677426.1 hypothetical protein [Streptomyces lichenis]